MRIVRGLLILAVGSLPCVAGYAQSNTESLGVCAGASKIACLLPFVTRVGTTSGTATTTVVPTGAQLFNGPIAAQLSQLPSAVSAPGVTVLFQNGNPQPFDNLGPILLDRPDSVGQGKLVVGASYQQYHFNRIDGIGLSNIPLVYSVSLQQTNPTAYLQQTEQVSFKFSQYIMLATYGLPKKFDISVIVPYGRVSVSASDPASIPTYQITPGNTVVAGPAFQNITTYVPGIAKGVGDVSLNLKRVLWTGGQTGKGSLAAGFAVRLPTGDALNYLGSGAYGYNLYAIASYKAHISPHVKYGYQWNSTSVLLNISQTGSTPNLPGGSQFAVGADAALSHKFTASVDLLANQFTNAQYISLGTITIPNGSNVVTPTTATAPACPATTSTTTPPTCSLSTIVSSTQTYTTANASMGIKFRPVKGMILYGNVLIQMNDVGLRAYPSPSGGISYSFNTKK